MVQERIDRAEALRLLQDAPLVELMARAHAARMAWHPRRDVTFVVDTNPNYTNVCTTACTFCSFYRKPGASDAYALSPAAVAENARAAHARGATTILLQGGHHPGLGLDYYLAIIAALRAAVPAMHLHLFSPAEIDHVAEMSNLSAESVLRRFHAEGLRTMPGGGAEILVERVRREISPKKLSAAGWLDIMRAAHRVGFKTSATMTYGHRETPEDIVEHLLRLRAVQYETGGFYAFIPWSFKPGVSALARLAPEAAPPSYYLRIIALSRLVLDNIPHIQASWFGEGARAGQLALEAGADDFGGVLMEENVLFQANHREASSMNTVLRLIREAGFTPVQRSTPYKHLRRYDVPTQGEDELTPPARAAGAGASIPARAPRRAHRIGSKGTMKKLRIGHSPDPDDAFMFYGFASGQAVVSGHEIEHVLHDIQTLNVLAAGPNPLEVTALSLHAFFGLEYRYELLEVGTSVGRQYGPRVVATMPMEIADLEGKRIALPGPLTTAALAAHALLPEFDAVHMDFTEISEAVLSGRVDAGILIHEGQLTYQEQGLHLVVDLGEEFARRHGGLPLPLGVNCVRKDIAPDLKKALAAAYRRSVEIAMTQRAAAVEYSLQYARGLATELADRFVGMYVNEDSLGFSSDVREAIEVLREQYVLLHEGRGVAAGAAA